MNWLFLIVGLASLMALQLVRTALSVVFPVIRCAPVRSPDAATFGGLDRIDGKTSALRALGFDGPAWLGNDGEAAAGSGVTAQAAYFNKPDRVVAWVGPTIDLCRPNQLLEYYSTLLSDGRYAVTQVSDPYFETVEDPRTPAQTIAASDETEALRLHREFVTALGVEPANASPQDAILRFANDHMNGIRARLLERGRIVESNGVARPSVLFGLRIIARMLTRPGAVPADANPVPASRLPFLASLLERSKERAPSQRMQWLLMAVSVALFLGIGWPLFGLELTAVILAVIVFHEAGHWLAMRLFGYRNPHITLLPLLGGVTIGHETDPSAANRAWVALAGPLPGIVLGWALLYWAGFDTAAAGTASGWLLPAIVVLLFVNYLNVLPIPPLDGSHVLQAILPPRWTVIQVIAVLLGVAVGTYVAYLLDFWPIAFIAALQLLGLRSIWRAARLVSQFSRSPPPEGLDKAGRTAWLLARLDEELGAPKVAMKRLRLAGSILTQLDTQPMGAMQRTIVSGVYLALLAVPVAALALSVVDPFAVASRPGAEKLYADYRADYEAFLAQARGLDDAALLHALGGGAGGPTAPASAESIAAAEARLGRRLPGELRRFYAQADGLPGLLLRVQDIKESGPAIFTSGDLQYYAYDGEFYFYSDELGDIVVPLAQASRWWHIGGDDELATRVFLDPDAAAGEASVFQFVDDALTAYTGMRGLLEFAWVEQQALMAHRQRSDRLNAEVAASMRGLGVDELMASFPEPSLVERLLFREDSAGRPLSPEALREAERRIGHALPGDYRRVLEIHNGFPPLSLLPLEQVAPAERSVDDSLQHAMQIAAETGNDAFTAVELQRCWIIAGNRQAADAEEIYALTYWCPEQDEARRYLSLASSRFAASFTELLRERAIAMNSY